MLCYINGVEMSIGSSGRLVIEIEPELKQELHSALRKEGMNLKSWFLENVDQFLAERGQLNLGLEEEQPTGEPHEV